MNRPWPRPATRMDNDDDDDFVGHSPGTVVPELLDGDHLLLLLLLPLLLLLSSSFCLCDSYDDTENGSVVLRCCCCCSCSCGWSSLSLGHEGEEYDDSEED